MLQVSPREIEKLVAETQSPCQILEGTVRDILFSRDSSAPDPDSSPDLKGVKEESQPCTEVDIERERIAMRVGVLQKLFADIETDPKTSIFGRGDINSVMNSIAQELLVHGNFEMLEHLLRGGALSVEVLTDPVTVRMAEFVCLDQIGSGVVTSLPFVAKCIVPAIFSDEKYVPAITDGLRSLLSQGQLRDATYFVLTYPQAKDILGGVLAEPSVAEMIISATPGPQTTGFTSFAEVRSLLASDDVQKKIEEALRRFAQADHLELVIDMLREQFVTDKTKQAVREYTAEIVKVHLSEILYYEEAEGRELEKARDRIQKQSDVVERLIRSLELAEVPKAALII